MPFGTISVNTKLYDPRSEGLYALSTLTFGNPKNEFRIKGGTVGKDGAYRASILRILEKDVTVNGSPIRRGCVIQLSITAPTDFTVTEIDGLTSDISEFMTSNTITRLLAGES